MRRFISSFLILIFLSPLLMKVGIIVDFKVHQDFIAKVLCINKDKPMSNCNGKCILAQKLKKAEEPQKKEVPAALKERSEINLYISEIRDLTTMPEVVSDNFKYFKNLRLYTSNHCDDVFHPPKG